MAGGITHSTVVVVADDGTSPVGTDEWNADHVVGGSLQINGTEATASAVVVEGTANTMYFKTAGVERVRIDSAGRVIIGGNAAVNTFGTGATAPPLQIHQSVAAPGPGIARWNNGSGGSQLFLAHSRSSTIGTHTQLNANDIVGGIVFNAPDGAGNAWFAQAAFINAYCEATSVAANEAYARLVFATQGIGDGGVPTERMRIDSAGKVTLATGPLQVNTAQIVDSAGNGNILELGDTFAANGGLSFNFAGANVHFWSIALDNIFGTGDIYNTINPTVGTGYAIIESWDGAGLILTTAHTAKPIKFCINRTEKMRIDASGNVNISTGTVADNTTFDGTTPILEVDNGNLSSTAWSLGLRRYGNVADALSMVFSKTRGTTGPNSHGLVVSGDILASMDIYGDDGAAFKWAGQWRMDVDATAAAGIVPTRHTFLASNAAGTTAERMRISGDGTTTFTTGADTTVKIGKAGGYNVLSFNGDLDDVGSTGMVIEGGGTADAVIYYSTINGGSHWFGVAGGAKLVVTGSDVTAGGSQVDLGTGSNRWASLYTQFASRAAPTATATSALTIGAAHNSIISNHSATCAVTLPTASSFPGRELYIKTIANQPVISVAANVIPLAGGATASAIVAATAGKYAKLVSDGATGWHIMEAN